MLDKMNQTTIDVDLLDEVIRTLESIASYVKAAHAAIGFSGGKPVDPNFKLLYAKGGGISGLIRWSDLEKATELYERLTNP